MLTNKFYTGIGSRSTPPDILWKMTKIAEKLESLGYILRSGGADGADSAFEKGSINKEIYLPWLGFNGNNSTFLPSEEAKLLVSKFHSYIFKQSHLKLHARNIMQVLGRDLLTLSKFVICWTKDGKDSGGTATAIRVARHYNIPVINLKTDGLEQLIKIFQGFECNF